MLVTYFVITVFSNYKYIWPCANTLARDVNPIILSFGKSEQSGTLGFYKSAWQPDEE